METSGFEDVLLTTLNASDSIQDSGAFAKEHNIDHQKLDGVVKSLAADNYVELTPILHKFWIPTDEGASYAQNGSPEYRVWSKCAGGVAKKQLEAEMSDIFQIGFSNAMKEKWVKFDKATDSLVQVAQVENDKTADVLRMLTESSNTEADDQEARIGNKALLDSLKKRKLVEQRTFTTYIIRKGSAFAPSRQKAVADLTPEMISSGEWRNVQFKPYNFKAAGKEPIGGNLHPLLKVRAQIRSILLEMGFAEMPTNNFVESSFWNFDALFQPQQHPARDSHDTFFISDPARTLTVPEDYLERVRKMHESGGHGSIGWRYNWSEDEARKNLLRTHTTAVSSRMLYQLAQDYKATGEFVPKKYFSIDRVFRNEALDATHLAEFHQIEGLVADRNLSLGDLIGTITSFFERMGITNLRFKPAYNPYTEPSMEIFGFHPLLNRWVEVGNSGIFRPEMLLPMGLPEDCTVIAWGLSLERPTMIQYGISNIRELFGHKIDIRDIRRNPICRYE
eukprot:GILJ01001805.1.p1 GENE.GILJ01001805.1~~GILJ01001805.1.p1  ORF type:complete len:519 (-),score=74.13 GILJ01001805.1:90-1607(-)